MHALSIIYVYPDGMSRRDEGRARLGLAIRLIRTGQDVNRKELAERTGLSYPYLSEIEAGKKIPSSKALGAIADALDVPASTLMEMAETFEAQPEPRASTSAYFHADPTAVADSMHPPMSLAAPPPASPPPAAVAPRAADDVAEIAEVASKLGPEDRNRLLDFARRLRR
ncbi:MAG: hypothetical protein QOG54_2683 [Actinomycetota bacterium]|nr:hypothetical protein [Actinomycetota bacterium]